MRLALPFSSINTESGDSFCRGPGVAVYHRRVFAAAFFRQHQRHQFSMACNTVARWPGLTLISAITVIIITSLVKPFAAS